jgi:hypothetical protein
MDSSVRVKIAACMAACGLLVAGSLAMAQSASVLSTDQVSMFPAGPVPATLQSPIYGDVPATMPTSLPTTAASTAPSTAPVTRRDITDPPIDSLPFPMTDWTGPDPVIGTNDQNPLYPFETLIKDTSVGHFLTDNRIRVYGWIDIGGNISSSKQSNSADSYDYIPNQVYLDQACLRVQRYVDTVQTDHVDWGFLFTNLYGTDYRYTIAKGYLSAQYLTHNREYGYDFPECYAEIYFPKVAEGMVVKVGRYISPADIEAQLAPQNYMYSHSDTFTYDPYTFTGINTVTKLSKEWTLELGLHFGNDQAPWVNSSQLNGLAMLQWKTDKNAIYAGLNSIGAGKYKDGHDDLQQVVGVWGHKFNDTFHMQTEAYYMWMFDALKDGDVINTGSETFPASPSNGAGTPIPGRADEWGFINYFEMKVSPNDYLTLRTDFFDDLKGQRTGYSTLFYTETFGWSHSFSPFLTFRPEIRYDHSFQQAGYDNGTRKNQVTLAADIIVWF